MVQVTTAMSLEEIESTYGAREAMEYDVVVVGAGPAGLARLSV
ncbi:electron-transferring-flavoprotein dehydrogenase [Ralstonia sp. UNCCL144]|jgi:electron-transferring-flavoprotein dehydrogenase|nr:electron-transferring-flavoprotein dehydrogenase [Ralstonia sp. UNCCL144]